MKIAVNCIDCGSSNLLSSAAILMPFVAERALGWGPVDITEDWGLNTIPAGQAMCRVNTRACEDCGPMFLDLRFGEEEMQNLYYDYRGNDYNALRIKYEPGYLSKTGVFTERTSWLDVTEAWIESEIGKPKTVLDWGGGSGINSCFLNDDVDLYIHDISNVDLEPGAKSYSDSQALRSFDLVTCMQVLEHVADPLDLLHTMTGFMSTGSFLYFELPFERIMQDNIGTDERVTLKRHWHEHINFFSERGLAELATRAGLKVVASRVYSPTNNRTGGEIFQFICTGA
jgi:hypothetical protein